MGPKWIIDQNLIALSLDLCGRVDKVPEDSRGIAALNPPHMLRKMKVKGVRDHR
jgi:hypothetical protein